MSETCGICRGETQTPCPARSQAIHVVCAFCGGRNFHHWLTCHACGGTGKTPGQGLDTTQKGDDV